MFQRSLLSSDNELYSLGYWHELLAWLINPHLPQCKLKYSGNLSQFGKIIFKLDNFCLILLMICWLPPPDAKSAVWIIFKIKSAKLWRRELPHGLTCHVWTENASVLETALQACGIQKAEQSQWVDTPFAIDWLLREVHLFHKKKILNTFLWRVTPPLVFTIIVQLNAWPR